MSLSKVEREDERCFFFKKNKETLKNYFQFERNETGIRKVWDWLKVNPVWLLLDKEQQVVVFSDSNDKKFIQLYTSIEQIRKEEKELFIFSEVGIEQITAIFSTYEDLSYVILNPFSDGVELFRSGFTHEHSIAEGTTLQIGLPKNPPREIITYLQEIGQMEVSIEAIYLALMFNEEFSYLVYIKSDQAKELVTSKIGPEITTLCKRYGITYPVDFLYSDMIEEEEYLIYLKKS